MVKFDHMNLPVTNSQASRDWYVKNFGFKVEFEVPARQTVALQDDAGFTIFFYPAAGQARRRKVLADAPGQQRRFEIRGAQAQENRVHEPAGQVFLGLRRRLRDPDGYQILLWDEVSMREKGG